MKQYRRLSYDETKLPADRSRLDPADKAQWVADLRSGNFKQGNTNLCYNEHYCCLGVYAERKATERRDGAGLTKFIIGGSACITMLPAGWSVLDNYGNLPIKVLFLDTEYDTLSSLNDNGATFDEIAWLIEEVY